MRKRNTTIALAFIFCLILASMTGCESAKIKSATEEFDSNLNAIQSLQNVISSKITEAEQLLTSTDPSDLMNPELLEALKKELEAASDVTFTIPQIADNPEQIYQQIAVISKQENALQSQYASLTAAISAINTNQQDLADKLAAEAEAALLASVSPHSTYTKMITTSDGYKIEATLRIGSWIKASDTELLAEAWSNVGGSGSVPAIESFKQYSGQKFRSDRSVMVFGTLSYKNCTQGYDITPEYPLSIIAAISLSFDDSSLGNAAIGVDYSNGIKFYYGYGYYSFSPKMTRNSWGPVPIVIAIADVFNPNHPTGNAALYDVVIGFGNDSIKIGTQWETLPQKALTSLLNSGEPGYMELGWRIKDGFLGTTKAKKDSNEAWIYKINSGLSGEVERGEPYEATTSQKPALIITQYSSGNPRPKNGGDAQIEFNLDNLYRVITGDLAVCAESADCPDPAILKVYGDNALLYTSPAMYGNSNPVDFSIDVTGVYKLKFESVDENGNNACPSLAVVSATVNP